MEKTSLLNPNRTEWNKTTSLIRKGWRYGTSKKTAKTILGEKSLEDWLISLLEILHTDFASMFLNTKMHHHS
jgi:hypothetical protein